MEQFVERDMGVFDLGNDLQRDMYSRRLTPFVWLASFSFFLVLSLSVAYILIKGMQSISGYGSTGAGILFVCLAIAICYVATAFYLKAAPPKIFNGTASRTLSDVFRDLPKLLGVFFIFIVIFSVISGLLSVLIFYGLASGIPEETRRTPINICVIIIAILSIPFFTQAFAEFASGENNFKTLLKNSFRIGLLRYAKYLGTGAIAFGLAMLIRMLFFQIGAEPLSTLLSLIITSAVLGIAVPITWILHEDKGVAK